ncbi:sulfite exporter TauE/SafE family protein [Brevibacillus parabrevis]
MQLIQIMYMNFPFIGAFLLGIVGALEPCQFSNHLAAFMLTKKVITTKQIPKSEFVAFAFGKITVYWIVGVLILTFGQGLFSEAHPVFEWTHKLLGPFFIIFGLYMLNIIHLPGRSPKIVPAFTTKLVDQLREGAFYPFGMGAAVALAFCPTMFWLFFGLIAPTMISNPVGILLPPVFGMGTVIPLMIVVMAISW